MTANGMPGDREKCIQAGMNDHVSKPVDPALFYATLMRWIRRAQAGVAEYLSSATDDAHGDVADFTGLSGIDVADGLRRVAGDAVELMDRLGGAISGSDCVTQLAALRQHLSAYDFDAALADLDAIDLQCQRDA